MKAIEFKGQTRKVGECQGFIGLPVMDLPIEFDNGFSNCMITVWKPTEEELMVLMHNGYVKIMIVGNMHPPITVDVLRDE
jgi:hypothetical protein